MAEWLKAAVLKTVKSLRASGVRIPLSPPSSSPGRSAGLIKVLLVDDHELVRIGIKKILEDVNGIRVVGTAGSGEEATKLVRELNPDVILMDVQMPGIGGLEATRKMLRYDPGLRILALTVCNDEPYPSRFLQAGAAGYITKGCDPDEMIRAIRCVHAGQRYISSTIAQQLALKRYTNEEVSLLDVLSERELQVMLMVVAGQKANEISKTLCLSPKTVNSYRYRIFKKLELHGDVELTLFAIRLGIIHRTTELS